MASTGFAAPQHVGSSWARGSNLCALHWQVDSPPLDHRGSPICLLLEELLLSEEVTEGPGRARHPPGDAGRRCPRAGTEPRASGSGQAFGFPCVVAARASLLCSAQPLAHPLLVRRGSQAPQATGCATDAQSFLFH